MGLASKLASAQGGAPGGYSGAPPPSQYAPQGQQGQQQQQQHPGQQYPGQGQYQAYMAGRGYQAYPGQQPSYPQYSQNSPYPPQNSPYRPQGSPYPPQNQPYPPQSPQYPPPNSPYPGAPYGQASYGQQQQQQQPPQQQYSSSGYNRPPPPPPGGQPGYGNPPLGQQWGYPAGQQPYSPGPNYGGYAPGQGQGQGPPQGQNQQGPPPGQQQQYGGAPAQQAGPQQVGQFRNLIQQQIREKGLEGFYPPNSPAVEQLAQKAAAQIGGLCQRWRIPAEVGNDLAKLGLYDIIIYIDDSGSMQFEENGERIKDLQLILQRVASVATMFDDDGVQLRFMNANYDPSMLDGIRSEQQVDSLMRQVQFKGLTPMGTALRQKVIDGIIMPKVQQRRYTKPTLVVVITDGQPAGEAQNAIFDTIKYGADAVNRQFGRGAIAFQFAQVGNDQKAREFLAKLDEDPMVGSLIDCTSNYENESEEMKRQGVDLTPELWLVKLLLGAIDSSYDRKDERQGGGGGGMGPQGGYGGPPPQQYGGPPQSYGGGPPGGYNQQGGYQQGGYQQGPPGGGAGGYGGPPQQQQQGYGRGGGGYPQQGGQPPYPGGQGGYGAPPPPRY